MTRKTTSPPLPDGLSDRSRRIWESETGQYARTNSAGRLAMLEEALRSLDRADALRARLDAEGETTVTKTTGAVHLHPLLRVEAAHRALFLKLARALALEWRPGIDGGD